MKVFVTSIMRNGEPYLGRYLSQVQALQRALLARGDVLRVMVAEGDSTDQTWPLLVDATLTHPGMEVMQLAHGGPSFGSVDDPTRWANIAKTWNRLFEKVARYSFDALIYVEADLLWEVPTMLKLLKDLEKVPAVAPLSMHVAGFFYDTWGHRAQGSHFGPNPPYHPGLAACEPGELFQLESAGSCLVMRGEVARACRFSEQDAMLGHDIYAKGYSLWLDGRLAVFHP